jgi:hypothetical protein
VKQLNQSASPPSPWSTSQILALGSYSYPASVLFQKGFSLSPLQLIKKLKERKRIIALFSCGQTLSSASLQME